MFDMVSNRHGEWYILKEVAPGDMEIVAGPIMTKEEAEEKTKGFYIREVSYMIRDAIPLLQKSGLPVWQALKMAAEKAGLGQQTR